MDIYLLFALILYIINGIAYFLHLKISKEDPSIWQILRVSIVYVLMALFWPIQVFLLGKLYYEEIINGKSDR
jgi:hypothetical protein